MTSEAGKSTFDKTMSFDTATPEPRRGFFKRALAVLVGGFVGLVPVLTGVAFFLDPLRTRKKKGKSSSDENGFINVATLDSLVVDVPQRVTVIDDKSDAWNLYPKEPVGAVFLTLSKDKKVTALNTTCPHAGCSVDFVPAKECFLCPCHDSLFKMDGDLKSEKSPSPRGLDSLEVEIKNGNEVWVKYQNFRAATKEKIPEA